MERGRQGRGQEGVGSRRVIGTLRRGRIHGEFLPGAPLQLQPVHMLDIKGFS